MNKQLLLGIAVGILALLTAEYQFVDTPVDQTPIYIPSRALTELVSYANALFNTLGKWAAWISGYLAALEWDKLWTTLSRILLPLWHLVWSPLEFITGYIEQSWVWRHPLLVPVGSGLLGALLVYLASKHPKTKQMMEILWKVVCGYCKVLGGIFNTLLALGAICFFVWFCKAIAK